MNGRKTPIPEPTLQLPKCLECGCDMKGPGDLCGRCFLEADASFTDIDEARRKRELTEAINHMATRIGETGGHPQSFHDLFGWCSWDCPCDNPQRTEKPGTEGETTP